MVTFGLGSCGIFALGDVLPVPDAGTADGSTKCLADGNPCACLPTPLTIVGSPHGSGVSIAVSGPFVYFLTAMGGVSDPTIFRAPIDGSDGGAPTEVMVASPSTGPIVIAGNSIFLRRTGTNVGVLRVATDAVSAKPTVHAGPLPSAPNDLAVDRARIYWPNGNGAICAVPLDGAAPPADLTDSGCGSQPVVAVRDGAGPANQIAVSDTDVFWLTYARIMQAPSATGTPVATLRVQAGGGIAELEESDGKLFWVLVGDAGTLWTSSDDGGAQTPIIASLVEDRAVVPQFVADSTGVFWGFRDWEQVMGASRDGANPHVLACDNEGVTALATDQAHVYWITRSGGVRRIDKTF